MNLEFRAEAFNAFNHAQFGQPDGNVNTTARLALSARQTHLGSCSFRSSCCFKIVPRFAETF